MPRVGLDGVLDRLDRCGTLRRVPSDAAAAGFTWQLADRWDREWYPQGITTSADASESGEVGGRRVILTSWYAKSRRGRPSRGSRLSVVDWTEPARPRYRHVLLVEPFRDRDSGAVDFRPVRVHAGGICWYGGRLYVAATGRGIRMFEIDDLTAVPDRAEGDDAWVGRRPDGRYCGYGYGFVLPQSFRYDAWTAEGVERLRYSFLSLDRTGESHQLVAGEYGRAGATTRLTRYRLDRSTGLLETADGGHAWPLDLRSDRIDRMQGATLVHGQYAITSSRGAWLRGDLLTGPPGDLTRHRGALSVGPEDIAYWPGRHQLWTLSEWPMRRWVYAIDTSRFLPDLP